MVLVFNEGKNLSPEVKYKESRQLSHTLELLNNWDKFYYITVKELRV